MPLRIPPDVTVFCDPALAPALRSLDAPSRRQIGTPVAVLSAPAALMLAQITRHTRNDVLFTLAVAMDDAVKEQLVKPETRVDGWNNPLVLAIATGGPAPPAPAALPFWLAALRVAVTDQTVVSGLDGRAVLAANRLTPGQIIGTANTGDAAFLATTGAADAALVYLSEVRADPKLAVLAPLTADPALTRFAAAVDAKAVSPNAQRFLAFLQSGPARDQLRAAGLATP